MRKQLMLGVIVGACWSGAAYAEAPPAEIRYNSIIEAPAAQVWDGLSRREKAVRWFPGRIEAWTPRADQPFRVQVLGEAIAGQFEHVDAPKSLRLTWPSPATQVTFEVSEIDEHLTLVSLIHSGWPEGEKSAHRRADLADAWLGAMMKLHRLFPPPIVDVRKHRPKAAGLFVERNLIANGDFDWAEPGRFEGIAWGWEPNSGKPSPKVHLLADLAGEGRGKVQCLKQPKDWTNFAIQQFTPQVVPVIQPGRRYRLSAMVKAEGIANPAGWYRLGLWFADNASKPIGDTFKNDKPLDADKQLQLNHDWRRYTVEAVAPPKAARAIVILSGHWDEGGTVWYDDVRLWEIEPPPTTNR